MDNNNLDNETEDFINRYAKDKPLTLPNTDSQLDVKFDEDTHSIFAGTVKYPSFSVNPLPTKVETIEGSFKDSSEFYQGRQFIEDHKHKNPFNDIAPEGWKVSDDLSVLEGIHPQNQGYVLNATSPQDAKNRQFNMIDRQLEDENWQNGSTLMKIVGGFGAGATNITTYAPIARAVKYAKLGENVLINSLKTIPSTAISSVAHEGWMNAVKQGGNLEDFVVDSAIDTVMGTAFFAGGFGLSHSVTATKLWNARKLVKLNYEGIDLIPELNEEGHLIGPKAVVAPGASLSAAKVDFAQKFADAEFAKNGMFAVPLLSGLLTKTGKTYNPIFRGLTSKYEAIRSYAQRMGSSGIYTKGIEAGEAAPINFDDEMFKLHADSLSIQKQYDGYYDEYRGIDPNKNVLTKTSDRIKAKFDKAIPSKADFGEAVANVLDTGKQSQHSAVNNAAQMIDDEFGETYKEWRTSQGYSEEFLSPATQKKYVARVINQDTLLTNKREWEQMVLKETKENETVMRNLTKPIDDMKQIIKDLKEKNLTLTDNEKKESNAKIKSARNKLKGMKDELQNKLRTDDTLRTMIRDIRALSANEANELNNLLKPINEIKKELKLKKTPEEIKDLKDKLFLEEDKLQELAAQGKINKLLYDRIPGTQRVKFKDPKNRLKFVKPFDSDFHILESARATRNTYLNQTNEQTISQVLNELTGIIPENHIKNRTNMIKDSTLRENKFLSTDLPLILNNYRKALGRQVILKKVFGDLSHEGGIEPIIERLNSQYESNIEKILNQKLPKEKEKKSVRKETKDYKEGLSYIKHSYDRAMGKSALSDPQRKFNQFQTTLSAFLKLGMTFLTMSGDMMGIVFKHGFFPSIAHGLLPMLRTMNGKLATKEAEHVREVAAAAHLANNHLLGAYRDQNMTTATEQHIPIQGKLANGLEWAANAANTLNLISGGENFLQRWTATVIQHKIMKFALDYQAGKLNPKDNKTMLLYGLNIKDFAERFIKGWKEKGSDGNGLGGYLSHYYEWSDTEASNMFADTVMRATRDTIIRRGIMDAPFFTDSSLWGSLYSTFKGWTFATGTRFLIPFMQNPLERNKIMGIMLMLGAGSTQSPLRKLASGQDLTDDDLDPETLFWNGIYNSGVFSIPAEAIQELNILTSGKLLKGVKNQKYQDRTIAGIAAGPFGGEVEDIRRIAMMVGTGNYNKNDIHRMIGLSGFGQSLWFRGLANKWLEATSLPKTASEAEKRNQ